MIVQLDIVMVVVTSTPSGDTISIALNAPGPLPSKPEVPAILELMCEARHGAAWSRSVLGIDPKQIIVGDGKQKP